MRCARDKTPAGKELILAWQCKQWNTLPRSGGILEQPAGLIKIMSAVINVYNAFIQIQKGNIIQIANSNPEILKIVREVEKLEKQYRG